MTMHTLDHLLEHLRAGRLAKEDFEFLERVNPVELVQELREQFPILVQERRIGKKWELTLARDSHPYPYGSQHRIETGLFAIALDDCLMLNIEAESVTGISLQPYLFLIAVDSPVTEMELETGGGIKLDLTPDGWALKPLEPRIVRLSVSMLSKRGWKFDHLAKLVSVA